MGTRKHNEPFREGGQSLGDALRAYDCGCSCDEPEEGESGIIVCTSCALLAFAEEADALLKAAEAVLRTSGPRRARKLLELGAAVARARGQ